MSFFVYILYSEKFDKYYIGQTSSIEERLLLHNSKKVQSTAPYVPWVLVMYITKDTRSESMGLEKKIKNLNRVKLLSFIEKYGSDSKGRKLEILKKYHIS
jgi:putative endonuclease